MKLDFRPYLPGRRNRIPRKYFRTFPRSVRKMLARAYAEGTA